jgi:hypothetical protein
MLEYLPETGQRIYKAVETNPNPSEKESPKRRLEDPAQVLRTSRIDQEIRHLEQTS